ncbi:hypothetical protein PXW05_09145 [Serratia marcescens]|uniref:hypothetical protein n=1 Tax=Serratia marcescens TaxID=615 RepID=UPI0023B07895|nr:hypothetical protein [Serratia marcescens]WEE06559.1 hypothetical protein PXW05_09145 [Serratia marcescens]
MSVHGKENFEAHIYLDHHYPPAQWNIVRGVFCSPSCLEESKTHGLLSISMASMLSNETSDRLVSEMWLEEVRREHYPENVSRLNGIFVFDDLDSLTQLWENNSWTEHFQDEYLADVGVSADKSSRVDSNWIADIIGNDGKLLQDWEEAAHNYWRGFPYPNKHPVWERIVEGYITVWSMDSKREALKDIEAIWPQSLNILRYAVLCACYGSLDGQTFPIVFTKEDRIELVYCLRLVQRGDQEFINSLNAFIEINPQFNCGIHCEGKEQMPDLRGYSRVITSESAGGFGDFVKHVLQIKKDYLKSTGI